MADLVTILDALGYVPGGGGGGGGSTTLAALTDTNLTAVPATLDGQPLIWTPGVVYGVVQHKSLAQDAVGTITLPAAPVVGNYLIVMASCYGGGTLLRSTTGQGFTVLKTGGASSRDYADIIARKVIAGDTATINLGCSPAQSKITIWEISSPTVDITTTIPTTVYSDDGVTLTSGAFDEGTLFTTSAASLVLVNMGWNGGTAGAFASPFLAKQDSQANVVSSSFQQTAAGAVTLSGTITGSPSYPSICAIVFPVTPPGPGHWRAGVVAEAGITTLAGDSDVAITSPSDTQILTFDATLGKWKNAAAPAGGGGGGVTANTGSAGTLPETWFKPPTAAQFTLDCYGRGSSGGLTVSDSVIAGLIGHDATSDNNGFKGRMRAIPTGDLGAFTFIGRTRSDNIYKLNAGSGLMVSAGTGGSSKAQTITRAYGIGSAVVWHGVYGGWWDGSSYTDLTYGGESEAEFFKVSIAGTVASFYFSRDCIVWNLYQTRDFGATITHYGFCSGRYNNGVNDFSVPFFESTEFKGVLLT